MEAIKVFDNKERKRYYGVRVGDRVRDNHFVGVVESYGFMDNNRVHVRLDDGRLMPCVAEWCEILKKVED